MKTKINKHWYGKSKSTEELHKDSKRWLSEIDFINDEIQFLDNLLGSKYIECIDAGLNTKIQKLLEQMNHEKQAAVILSNSVKDHEIILDNLIAANSVTGNNNYLHTHEKFEREMDGFLLRYKDLKMQIFDTIENVMKKKDQKKIAK